MKTKELIRQLQMEDPSGELEVVVDGIDILSVSREPGYYDGAYETLIRDPMLLGYNVVGARVSRAGEKVRIRPWSIQDAVWENPQLEFIIDESINPESKLALERWHAALKEEIRIEEEVWAQQLAQKK